ncbi:ABC transporter permease [Agrococcus sp. ARC_14]|uniref:ABC transporter permease n=1 Tax=Agrococcus sp. ARC_14 TaxID=2919927 RepID=UPI001F054E4F|nr:ABC transporter permease [Agrococcus sp. ARC_14]MCH1882002.1 ABC transporter permease [Agrococcus sp. ARC_14]
MAITTPVRQAPDNKPNQQKPSVLEAARGLIRTYAIGLVLVALIVIGYIATPDFLTAPNAVIILRQTALVGIVAVGMTFVILTSGIDLSVGSTVGLVAVVTGFVIVQGFSVPLALLVGVIVGACLGALNGLGVTLAKVPPFVMTLGMMTAARGLALTLSNGRPVALGEHAETVRWIGAGDVLGVPVPVVIFAVVVLAASFVLRYTAFGRAIYAVGDNPEAARLSGIRVQSTIFSAYVIAGVLAAVTGIIYIARLTVGEPTAGMGLELDAIAVVVIGGTSLFGGQGKIWGTVLGAFIVTVLSNILDLLAVSPFTQQIVTGALLVAAVVFERLQHRRDSH